MGLRTFVLRRLTARRTQRTRTAIAAGRKERSREQAHFLGAQTFSFPSAASRYTTHPNRKMMHHACKHGAWYPRAVDLPNQHRLSVRQAVLFCRFPVPLCIFPPLPLSRCVGTNSVKMYCACSVRVQLPLSAKFKYCFINCSLYFADNVLYYPCAESEGSL